jgi:predicted glycosyltransferase
LEELYSEIWIYGIQEFYDPITEYGISESIIPKMHFTGYIPRKVPGKEAVSNIKKEQGLRDNEKLVVVTTGGGGDGFAVMDTYLKMLEHLFTPLPIKSVMITGPFMPKQQRKMLFKRARKLGVRTYHFYRQMEKIFAAADLVVTMGGYNTLCEILSQGTLCLVVPREAPRKEQMLRAQTFHQQKLVAYIPWHDLSPDALFYKIQSLFNDAEPYKEAIRKFQFTGIQTMKRRLQDFREKKS